MKFWRKQQERKNFPFDKELGPWILRNQRREGSQDFRMLYLWVFVCCISYFMGFFAAAGNVVMIAKNVTLSFEDIEANFGELD